MDNMLQPRHIWLIERIQRCIEHLRTLECSNDWEAYLSYSLELANEIKYAAEQWETYYCDCKKERR